MAALRVTLSMLVLTAPAVPPSTAVTVPLRRSKAAVLVSTPVLPLMMPPPCSDSDATVSLRLPMSSVPALTVTALSLAITSLAASASVPPSTVVAPV